MNRQNLGDTYYTQDVHEGIRRSYIRGIRDRTNGETDLHAMRRKILKLRTQLRNSFLPIRKTSLLGNGITDPGLPPGVHLSPAGTVTSPYIWTTLRN